jgi:hypothetical protein
MHPEFQSLPEGYGIIWSKSARRYHACGWNPALPYFKDYPRPHSKYFILPYMDAMSQFSFARESKWYKDNIKRFENFKNTRETYIFPKEYLMFKFSDAAFLSDENMKLKATVRRELLREIIGTMKVYRYTRF